MVHYVLVSHLHMCDRLCVARQRAAEEVGASEAAALLQDWLVLFAAAYNRSLSRTEDAGPASAAQVLLHPPFRLAGPALLAMAQGGLMLAHVPWSHVALRPSQLAGESPNWTFLPPPI